MKRLLVLLVLVSFMLTLMGCGETINGVSKDINRMGKGIRTIFVRNGE